MSTALIGNAPCIGCDSAAIAQRQKRKIAVKGFNEREHIDSTGKHGGICR